MTKEEIEALSPDDDLWKSQDFVQYAISISGEFLSKVDPNFVTEELIQKAIRNGFSLEEYKNLSEKSKDILPLWKSKSFSQYAVSVDGECLKYVSLELIDENLIKIATGEIGEGHLDESKNFDLGKLARKSMYKFFGLWKCEAFLKYAISKNVNYFEYAYLDFIDNPNEIIRFAEENGFDLEEFTKRKPYSLLWNTEAFALYTVAKNNIYLAKIPKSNRLWKKIDFVKKALHENGQYLTKLHPFLITEELINIAISHQDKSKCFDLEDYAKSSDSFKPYNLFWSESFCRYAIEQNYAYLERMQPYLITPEIIADVEKRGFSLEEVKENSPLWSSEAFAIYAIKHDPQYIKLVDNLNSLWWNNDFAMIAINQKASLLERCKEITEDLVQYAITKGLSLKDFKDDSNIWKSNFFVNNLKKYIMEKSLLPTGKALEILAFDEEVINFIINNIKNDDYSLEDLMNIIKINIDDDTIDTEFFQTISQVICDKLKIDHNYFLEIVQANCSLNSSFLKTLNFKLLNEKYQELYSTQKDRVPFDRLYHLAIYPDIQEKIISIGESENGKEKITLLRIMFDKAMEVIDDWPLVYSFILDTFTSQPDLIQDIVSNFKDIHEIANSSLLDRVINYSLGQHSFKISTVAELQNYEQMKETWIDNFLKDNDATLEKVREAVLEKAFGMSYQMALALYQPFYRGIEVGIKKFENVLGDPTGEQIVQVYKRLHEIMQEEDIEVLRESAKEIKTKDLQAIAPLKMRSAMKKVFLEDLNSHIFKCEDKRIADEIDDVQFYLAAGEDGSQPFNMFFHALGAYEGSDNPYDENYNYRKSWERPRLANHGICTSYIGNNNLGVALSKSKCANIGFVDIEKEGFLACGPTDIYSDTRSFSTIEGITSEQTDNKKRNIKVGYFFGQDLLDWTRHNHNEVDIERRVGKEKRKPAYVVLDCSTLKDIKKMYEEQKQQGRYENPSDLYKAIPMECDKLYQALKAAKEFGIPIVVIERKKIAKNEKKKIGKSLAQFLASSTFTKEDINKYFYDIITTFSNNLSGSHHIVDYFKSKTLEKILEKIKKKIAETDDKKLAFMMIDSLLEVVSCEQKKQRYEGAKSCIPFDFNGILQFCRNEQRKRGVKVYSSQYIRLLYDGKITDELYLKDYEFYLEELKKIPEEIEKIPEQLESSQVLKKIKDNDLIPKLEEKISLIDEYGLYGRSSSIHARAHIENVTLFAALIGKEIGLSEKDLDLLLTAAVFHDSGRNNDGHDLGHSNRSSLIALEKLKDSETDLDLSIIQIAIRYHEVHEEKIDGHINPDKLLEICKSCGIENISLDSPLFKRIEKISFALKDADALDRTRFRVSKSFTNPNYLHYDFSKRLIKLGEQLNECYAMEQIKNIQSESLELLFDFKANKSPKEILKDYFLGVRGNIKPNESGVKHSGK